MLCSQRLFLLGFVLNKYKKCLYYLQVKSIFSFCPSKEIWLPFKRQIGNELEGKGAVLLISARLKILLNEEFVLYLIQLYFGERYGEARKFVYNAAVT